MWTDVFLEEMPLSELDCHGMDLTEISTSPLEDPTPLDDATPLDDPTPLDDVTDSRSITIESHTRRCNQKRGMWIRAGMMIFGQWVGTDYLPKMLHRC